MKNLGDKIAVVAQPIAKGLDAMFHTNVAGCGGCNQMQQNLNAGMSISSAVMERWFKNKQEGKKMTFIMQIKIDADKLSQAVSKLEAVEGVDVIGVNPAPQQMQTKPNTP